MDSITQFLSKLLSLENGSITLWESLVAILVAYFGGLIASLTPCVYPMIPITVSVVGGVGPVKRSWQDVSFRGLIYVSGMAVVYSFLGVLAGITGKVFGTLTNTWGWFFGLSA